MIKKEWQKLGLALVLLILCSLLAACTFTQNAFTRSANNAGSAFAAAEETLTYAHEGKITYSYASSSFENYRSELQGTDQALTGQGATDKQTLHKLLVLYSSAIKVVDAPCLSSTCNWHKQVELLNQASQAFLEAGNS
jgi:hypothetical protein